MIFTVFCNNCLRLHLHCPPRVQSSHDSGGQTRLAPPRVSGDLVGHWGEVGRVWTCADWPPVQRGHRARLVPLLPTKPVVMPWRGLGRCASLHSALRAAVPGAGLSACRGPWAGIWGAGPARRLSQKPRGKRDVSGPALSRAGPVLEPQTCSTWRPFLQRGCRCRSPVLKLWTSRAPRRGQTSPPRQASGRCPPRPSTRALVCGLSPAPLSLLIPKSCVPEVSICLNDTCFQAQEF